jgi:hypothetical protein
MTQGYSPYTTVAALRAADKILGPERAWRGNPTQDDWVSRFYKKIVPSLASMPEIVANATTVPKEHVAFMESHGWAAQIKECPPKQFLAGACLDNLVKWKVEGAKRTLKAADGKSYPGAYLSDGVSFWQTTAGASACIATTSADRVWLILPPQADAVAVPLDVRGLATFCQGFLAETKQSARYDGLHFPMIDMTHRQILDWLKGLSTLGQDGQSWSVFEAIQQLVFKMNHKGARVRAADEMRVGVTSVMLPSPPLVIDRPFLAVVERPTLPLPIFAGLLEQDCWKDPGEL